ncbi:glutathione S-transferase 3 [Venturia nashicola]|nr:glutathione S-transferase 3 [Venturia nashicola]
MLIVHHLQRSQSERIVWLCEELQIPYELKNYARRKDNLFAPPEYKSLHATGTAPIIQDGSVTLAESAAIAEYILTKYGKGKLVIGPDQPNYAEYLYWFHASNGSFQPSMGLGLIVESSGIPADHLTAQYVKRSREKLLKMLDNRLKENAWLAGDEFTAADVMVVFTLSTMRLFTPYELTGYDGILVYLKRIGDRPGYKSAMEKGDPGFVPIFGAEVPEPLKRQT